MSSDDESSGSSRRRKARSAARATGTAATTSPAVAAAGAAACDDEEPALGDDALATDDAGDDGGHRGAKKQEEPAHEAPEPEPLVKQEAGAAAGAAYGGAKMGKVSKVNTVSLDEDSLREAYRSASGGAGAAGAAAGGDVVKGFFKKLVGGGKQEVCMFLTGPPAAGKTTALYKLKLGEVVTTIPSLGFNGESVEYKHCKFCIVEGGGKGFEEDGNPETISRAMALLQGDDDMEGIAHSAARFCLVLVVDCNDREGHELQAERFKFLVPTLEKSGWPLLIFANKQDLPNARSVSETTDLFGLHSLRHTMWYIQAACCVSGDGLYEGLDWLANALRR